MFWRIDLFKLTSVARGCGDNTHKRAIGYNSRTRVAIIMCKKETGHRRSEQCTRPWAMAADSLQPPTSKRTVCCPFGVTPQRSSSGCQARSAIFMCYKNRDPADRAFGSKSVRNNTRYALRKYLQTRVKFSFYTYMNIIYQNFKRYETTDIANSDNV